MSPDGRWWAGPMRGGMFLVDLRDGSTEVLALERPVGMASFTWSPDGDELVLVLRGRSRRVSVPDLDVRRFPRPRAYPKLRSDGSWVECDTGPGHRISSCTSYAPDGGAGRSRPLPDDLAAKSAGGFWDLEDDIAFYSLGSLYGNYRRDCEVVRADDDFRVDARLVLPKGSRINGVLNPFDADTLQLAAVDDRQLLAWLVEDGEIVRLTKPGVGARDTGGMDWWDVCFARGLVRIR